MSDSKRIALVLSGGASKGAFQVGVMAGLAEADIRPTIFTGVSVGALNAALAAQYGMDDLWWFWKDITFGDVYDDYNIFRKLWNVWQKGGLMGSGPLRRMIAEHIDPQTIINRGVTLRIGATSLDRGEYEIFGPESPVFRDALLASTTIPLSVAPVIIDGRPFVDGGVRNVTPIGAAIKFNPDEIIIVSTEVRSESSGHYSKFLGSTGLGYVKHAIDTLMSEGFESDYREFERINELMAIEGNTHPRYRHIPCMEISPEESLGRGSVFEPSLHQKRYALGYLAARKALQTYAR
jgi:NTE family protein